MMSMNLSNTVILNIKGSDYHCIVSLIGKNEAIILMKNGELTEKVEHYKLKKYKEMRKYIHINGKMNYKIW